MPVDEPEVRIARHRALLADVEAVIADCARHGIRTCGLEDDAEYERARIAEIEELMRCPNS